MFSEFGCGVHGGRSWLQGLLLLRVGRGQGCSEPMKLLIALGNSAPQSPTFPAGNGFVWG